MTFSRRHFLFTSLLAGCSRRLPQSGCASLIGQNVRWIVPFAAGGGTDVYSRLFERPLEKALGAEIVISNETGGGSLVGLTKLSRAAPDGRTLGIVNTPGLLSASLLGRQGYPSLTRDLAILGRLVPTPTIIVTGAQSRFRTIEDLLDAQRRRPLLCGAAGLSSNNLLNVAVSASLLGLRADYLLGFNGNPEVQLAALRGDIDIFSNAYQNLRAGTESGDLRVLLQISDGPIADDPVLKDVPWLAGPRGWAVRRAAETRRSPEQALADSALLAGASQAGTTVAAPGAVPADLLACLRSAFDTAVGSPEFLATAAAAKLPVDPLPGDRAALTIASLEPQLARFAPIMQEVIKRVVR